MSQEGERVHTTEQPTSVEKPPFALDRYGYTQKDLDSFVDRLSTVTATDPDRYKQALERGGGKAFGLQVCEVVAKRFKGGSYRLEVPSWQIHQDGYSINPNRGDILRSSALTEDWLDPASGTLQSFNLNIYNDRERFRLEQLTKTLPRIPYVLQGYKYGIGMVVDIGFSKVLGKVVARVASGIERRSHFAQPGLGQYFTSATEDGESSFATYDVETGELVIPAQSFYSPSPRIERATSGKNFVQPLYKALQESGIDFGVQMEIIVNPNNEPNRLNLVQIRPTPGQIYRRIPIEKHEPVVASEQLVAISSVVNGAFDCTREPTLFGRDGIAQNYQVGLSSKGTDRKSGGRIGIYVVSRAGYIGLNDPYQTPRILFGGYVAGCDVQLTPNAIRPNSKHGDLVSNTGEKYNDELDQSCGMISLPEDKISKLQQLLKSGEGRVRVLSDGLVAAVYVVKSAEEPKEVTEDPMRGSKAYKRLREKFGVMDMASGFSKDSLTVGDLFDIALLYQVTTGNQAEELGGHIAQQIKSAVVETVRHLPAEQRGVFQEQLNLLRNPADLNSIDRDDPLFKLPVNCQALVNRRFQAARNFEISHYPGGLILREDPKNIGKYILILTRRNQSDEPVSREILQEVGLPVS